MLSLFQLRKLLVLMLAMELRDRGLAQFLRIQSTISEALILGKGYHRLLLIVLHLGMKTSNLAHQQALGVLHIWR